MEISVVIPTYNNRDVLRETVRHLRGQTLAADLYEIVVVDDGSTDGTAQMLDELAAHWKERWALPRAQRDTSYRNHKRDAMRVSPELANPA